MSGADLSPIVPPIATSGPKGGLPVSPRPGDSGIQRVALVGAGHCGRMIASCLVTAGKEVLLIEENAGGLERARSAWEALLRDRLLGGRGGQGEYCGVVEAGSGGVSWHVGLEHAAGSDLVIESVPERLALKREIFQRLVQVVPASTLITTNTSYYLPSSLARGLSGAERFAALHFHVPPWYARAVDIMPTGRTSAETVDRLQRFVREIGLEPIRMVAEYPGYVFNSLLQLLLMQSLELVERGVSSAEEVDRSWRAVTHMPVGPFGMMQQIGLTTLREIVGRAAELIRDERSRRAHALLTGPRAEALWAHLPVERRDEFAVYREEWQQTECEQICAMEQQQREHAGHWCLLSNKSFTEGNDARWRLLTDTLESWEVVDRRGASWLSETGPSEALESISRSSQLIIVLDGAVTGEPWQELAGWIRFMRRWLGDEQQGKRVCVVIDWQRLVGISPRGWGHAGMWRALWMEGLAIARESAVRESAARESIGEQANCLDIVVMEGDLEGENIWRSVGRWCRRERLPSNDLSAVRNVVTNEAMIDRSWERKVFERLQRRVTIEADSGERFLVPRLVLEATLPPVNEVLDSSLRGTTWIVTGGGRGITARMALALARHGAKLEILGRTVLREQSFQCWPGSRETSEARVLRRQEAIRTGVRSGLSAEATARRFDAEEELLRTWSELTELGTDFRYHQCDVADRSALASVMDEVRGRRGEVSGILHGAGSEWTARLAKKDDAAIEQTLRAKIQGSVELARWIGRRTRWFVTCSSLAGFWGGVGQVDYAAANRFLMDQAEELSKLHQHVRVLSIAWPGWQGVGMAARPASRWALQRAGMRLIAMDEGVRHFLRLLVTPGSPVVQVVCREDLPAELFGETGNA